MKLLYFAWIRQRVGKSEETISLPGTISDVAGLIGFLRGRGEGYEAAFRDPKAIRCAVNQNHAGLDARVGNGDEVAFFPPVTGG